MANNQLLQVVLSTAKNGLKDSQFKLKKKLKKEPRSKLNSNCRWLSNKNLNKYRQHSQHSQNSQPKVKQTNWCKYNNSLLCQIQSYWNESNPLFSARSNQYWTISKCHLRWKFVELKWKLSRDWIGTGRWYQSHGWKGFTIKLFERSKRR